MADAAAEHTENMALPRSPPADAPPASSSLQSINATNVPVNGAAESTPVDELESIPLDGSKPSDIIQESLMDESQANRNADDSAPMVAGDSTRPGPPTPPAKAVMDARTPASPPESPSIRSPSKRPADLRLNGHATASSSTLQPATPGTPSHKRSLTMSKGNTVSVVLISSALETIASSREAKRSAPLKESVQRALEMVRAGEGGDKPREIFEPLRLACETRNERLMIASLDCISKLISYSFFVEMDAEAQDFISPPPSPGPSRHSMSASQASIPPPSLVDLVVHTVTACHTETTPDPVSLQIVKALLALVLSPTILVHQSSLLKAVRTVYNVFLLSTDPVTQTVAQGGLTQMVNHVFTRCKVEADPTSTLSEHEQADGIVLQSASSSKRPSTSVSTPETVPLPPLTPPPNSENYASMDAERQGMQIVNEIVEKVNGSASTDMSLETADGHTVIPPKRRFGSQPDVVAK
jgi:brefeldin A-inhibited guanine nucleotide-exchange protein